LEFYLRDAQTLLIGWFVGRPDFVVPIAPLDFGPLASGDVELSGNGYLRLLVIFGATNWPVDQTVNPNLLSNLGVVSFGVASADWVQCVKLAVFNHTSGGVRLVTELVYKLFGQNTTTTFR
jgi:hypothetical protein